MGVGLANDDEYGSALGERGGAFDGSVRTLQASLE
jgi:hypothetical protein